MDNSLSQLKEDDVQSPASSQGEITAPAMPTKLKVLTIAINFIGLQSLMLQIAANWIEQEKKDLEVAKEVHMAETCPKPDLSGDMASLVVR